MSKKSDSDVLDYIGVLVIVWMVLFFAFNIQLSLRVEIVPSTKTMVDGIIDTWSKSTEIEYTNDQVTDKE